MRRRSGILGPGDRDRCPRCDHGYDVQSRHRADSSEELPEQAKPASPTVRQLRLYLGPELVKSA